MYKVFHSRSILPLPKTFYTLLDKLKLGTIGSVNEENFANTKKRINDGYDKGLSIEPHSSTWQGELGEKGISYTTEHIKKLLIEQMK